MEKKNIKKIVRALMPETNSSSSHSVTISSNICTEKYPESQNLILESTGIIRFREERDFGWEWERYNDSYTKSLYVLASIDQYHYTDKVSDYNELIEIFKKVICDYTGANDVIIENVPSIDHQSYDTLDIELLKNPNDLKDFIFNPASWLFLGNDNGDVPPKFYTVPTETYSVKVVIHFPGIGDDLFEFTDFPTWEEFVQEIHPVVSNLEYSPIRDTMESITRDDTSFMYLGVFNEKLIYVQKSLVPMDFFRESSYKDKISELIEKFPDKYKFIDYEFQSEFGCI